MIHFFSLRNYCVEYELFAEKNDKFNPRVFKFFFSFRNKSTKVLAPFQHIVHSLDW